MRPPASPVPTEILDWREQPPSVLSDLKRLAERGASFAFVPREQGGRWWVEVDVRKYPDDPSHVLQVGFDVDEAEAVDDGDALTTDWIATGKRDAVDDVAHAVAANDWPLLMGVRDYPTTHTAAALAELAEGLARTRGVPMSTVSGLTVKAISRIRPGEVARIVVPPGIYPAWPEGREWDMRATSVTWESRSERRATELDLISSRDAITYAHTTEATPPPHMGLVATIDDLASRIARLESRRTP